MSKILTKISLVCIVVASFILQTASALEQENSIKINNNVLVLNGQGIRDKFFFDVYSAALYLEQPSNNGLEIINSNKQMTIRLIMLRDVDGDSMRGAIKDGFVSSLGDQYPNLEKDIQLFLTTFGDEASYGNVYTLSYQQDIGTTIYINNTKTEIIKGFEFKQALFSIWLGDKPAQESLKQELLGN
ncbi:chalcone isomerase family protein [Thalassomonas sp. M1454]|uniref:chalcone isomerase family protein n=1 Tax=Thalassomonas sp. M1454 TaxID=2594477 RepID=UPI00163DB39D|nr:chalcone isomerase family protein [Thalassomonas sp. M1454]